MIPPPSRLRAGTESVTKVWPGGRSAFGKPNFPRGRLTAIESRAIVFETLFQFLFEYRPHVFQQGDFRFAPPAGAPVVAVVLAAGLAIAFISYRLVQSRVQWRERAVLGVLRVAALGIILFCIFRPVLVVKAAVTQQNVVGILIDDSRSMQLPASNSATGSRADLVQSVLAGQGKGRDGDK